MGPVDMVDLNKELDLAFNNVNPKDWYLSLIGFDLGHNCDVYD